MEPFFSELGFNATLFVWVGVGTRGSNGFPRSHADLNGGHPGPGKNRSKRVLAIEMHSTSFSPKSVNNKTTKNVQRLPKVGEAAGVVRQEPGGVVLSLHRRFAQENERPSYVQIMRRVPFRPDPFESFPGALGHGAL